jgi:hypothetical protein
MRRISWMRRLAPGATLLGALLFVGCRPETLTSVWYASSSVRANGHEWLNLPAYRVKDIAGRITVINDSGDVCLGLYSSDRHLARRLRGSGLTVWLTSAQNKTEKVGVHYPIGMQKKERQFRPSRFLPNENLPPSEMQAMFDLQNDEIEIFAADSTRSGRKSSDEAAKLGVHAQLTEVDSAIAYLLIVETSKLAPWLSPGSKALLEIESPAMERVRPEDRRFSGERGRGGGGMPGGRGGFPPEGGGGGRYHGPSEGRGRQDNTISSDRPIYLSFVINLTPRPPL